MAPAAIDLSSLGAVKAQPAPAPPPTPAASPAPSGAIDLSSLGAVPHGAAQPAPSAPPSSDITANPNGEGTYLMAGPNGKVGIPYSKVEGAKGQGYKFDVHDETRYMHDYIADPNGKLAHKAFYKGLLDPSVQMVEGAGGEGMRTVAGVLNILANGREQSLQDQRNFAAKHNPANPTPGTTDDPIVRHTRAAADWLNRNAETDGFWQRAGGFGENLLELMTPESLGSLAKGTEVAEGAKTAAEAGKATSAAEKYAQAAKITQMLDKYPRIKSLVAMGLSAAAKASTEVGAQTYVKTGGDTQAAIHAAGMAGAIGGTAAPAIAAGGEALAGAIGKRATTLEDVGGVQTPIPAEVRNREVSPQQQAGQQSIRNAARSTLAGHLEEVNESRAVPDSPPGLPSRTGPYQFQLQTGPTRETPTGEIAHPAAKATGRHSFEQPAFTTASAEKPTTPGTEGTTGSDVATATPRQARGETVSGGGIVTTENPEMVRDHIATLNKAIDAPEFENLPPEQQSQLLDARSDAQRQMREYADLQMQNSPRNGRPNFEQIDIPKTVSKIGSYTEAADHLEGVAVDGYHSIADSLRLNDLSGGKFATLRNANKAAWKAYTGATTLKDMHVAEAAIDTTNRQIEKLLTKDLGGAITPKELAGFNDAYKASQRLRYVANAVDGAFSGNASNAARSWEYRGFDGNKLMGNLTKLEQKFGRPGLERAVGRDNLNTLYQVAELNRSNAARARFGLAVKPIAQHLQNFLHVGPVGAGAYLGHLSGIGYEAGAALGAGAVGTAMATRRVMDAVLTNPKVAQNLIFAIESGARPEHYAPLIATMIQQTETQRSREQQQQQQQAREEAGQ